MAAFWKKTSNALQTVSDAYKGTNNPVVTLLKSAAILILSIGYQPYEFTYVKALTETSLKLANDPGPPEEKL